MFQPHLRLGCSSPCVEVKWDRSRREVARQVAPGMADLSHGTCLFSILGGAERVPGPADASSSPCAVPSVSTRWSYALGIS